MLQGPVSNLMSPFFFIALTTAAKMVKQDHDKHTRGKKSYPHDYWIYLLQEEQKMMYLLMKQEWFLTLFTNS